MRKVNADDKRQAAELSALDGGDLRREPLDTRKATLVLLLKQAAPGLRVLRRFRKSVEVDVNMMGGPALDFPVQIILHQGFLAPVLLPGFALGCSPAMGSVDAGPPPARSPSVLSRHPL